MDHEPVLLAPVLVMALALIVTGGITTGLVESADQAGGAVSAADAGPPDPGDATPAPTPTGNVTATPTPAASPPPRGR